MRALVLWADDRSTNLGVHALAAGARDLVLGLWPDAEIDFQSYGPGVAPSPPRASTLLAGVLGVDRTYRRWLGSYDLVLDTEAGDSFTDIYGARRLLEMAAVRRLAVRAGTPVVMTPQTLGPFDTRFGRLAARASLRGVRRVFARDETSLAFGRDVLRTDPVLATDMVFAVRRPPLAPSRDVLFNVSGLLWEPNPHVDHARYREAAVAYCRWALEQGHQVALLAHVLDSGHGDNDRPAVEALAAALDGAVEPLIPTGLDDVRSMIATGRLLVGARMHACLNALSIGVPALPWAYSRKFAPLLGGLQWPSLVDLRETGDVAARAIALSEGLLAEPPAAALARVRALADQRLDHLRADLRAVVA